MRIIFVVDTYYPRQDGVQAVTQYLAEGLVRKGHELLIITSLKKGLKRAETHNGVTVERYEVHRNQYTMHFVGERRAIDRRIKEYCPDAIVFVSIGIWCFDWFRNRLNRYPGKKVLYTHGFTLKEKYSVIEELKKVRICRQMVPLLMNVYRELYWKLYKKDLAKQFHNYDKTVYLCEKESLFSYMKEQGIQNDVIIENAVEDSFFDIRAFEKKEDEIITFINVSSYIERKNQKLLLNAFYEAKVPNAKLILIGSKQTDYYRELLKENERLKQKHKEFKADVSILVNLSREQVKEIFKEAKVYLSASSWEAMSISVCEAAAAGLAIVSTDVGHVAMIPGAQICEKVNEFREAIMSLCFNPDVRADLGKEGYEYAWKHYRIQTKVDELEKILSVEKEETDVSTF